MAVTAIFSLFALCLAGSLSLPFSSPYLRPHIVYQPPPIIKYFQPFNPHFDLHAFQTPPFGAEVKAQPCNTTEADKIETTTSKQEEVSTETVEHTIDYHFEDLLTKLKITPFSGSIPQESFITNIPAYPGISAKTTYTGVGQNFDNLNKAYGLPGFRPFFYDDKSPLKARCNGSTDPFLPCYSESPPSGNTANTNQPSGNNNDILVKLNRMTTKPDATIIVFNTNDSPFQKSADTLTEDIDVRLGEQKTAKEKKSNEEPYIQAYKDIMFLNKSFLSTVAPYLHK